MADFAPLDRKSQLAAELDRARAGLAQSWLGLREAADVPAHVRESYQRHKPAWLGAAAVAGWILARLPARKKKVKIYVDRDDKAIKSVTKAGMLLGIVKLAMPLFKPMLTRFVTDQFAEFAMRKTKFRGRR